MDKQIKTAIYIRCKQENLKNKLKSLRCRAAENRFSIINCYFDADCSGHSTNRNGYTQMISDARDNLFDVLIVEKLSDLWRNTLMLLNTVNLLTEYGVRIFVVNNGTYLDIKNNNKREDVTRLCNEINRVAGIKSAL